MHQLLAVKQWVRVEIYLPLAQRVDPQQSRLENLSKLLTSFDSTFDADVTADNLNGTSASIAGYLIDTDGNLAVNDADVDKLIGTLVFASTVSFTDATTTLTMSFNVGEGMSLYDDGSIS